MSALRKAAEARLAELRAEAARGEQALAELDARRAELGRMMLRIAGAVQVLEETLAAADASASSVDPTTNGSREIGPIHVGPIPDGPTVDGSASAAGAATADEPALASAAA
ncbi:MAG TPA: hypothetical protein VFR81_20245 [Longimicrobium sp.]|nr:hypothetical protein [Longimicrobium sp.]